MLCYYVTSLSSWGDSILDHSDEDEDKHKSVLSLSPVDLRRKESQKSATDGGLSTPGLSRNDSSFSKLSRHDSTHSNQSFLSTPPNLSRNTSLKLLPTAVNIISLKQLPTEANTNLKQLPSVVNHHSLICLKLLVTCLIFTSLHITYVYLNYKTRLNIIQPE